jgi:hypothetical protein
MAYQVTTQDEVRKQFKEFMDEQSKCNPEHQDMTQTDIRCAFVDFVDVMQKDGVISERLAERVTLNG